MKILLVLLLIAVTAGTLTALGLVAAGSVPAAAPGAAQVPAADEDDAALDSLLQMDPDEILYRAFSAVGAAALLQVIPAVIKMTAEQVHSDAASVPTTAQPPSDPRYAAAVEQARQLARELVAAQNLPGVSVAVGVGGQLVWAQGFGWADIEARTPITPATQFRIGNVSTPLTAAGVGVLLARRQLDLDVPVQAYVPGFPEKQAPISTRQAMAHTAGLRHLRGDRDYLPRRHCDTVEQGLDLFAGDRLRFDPGTDWAFSTYGWILVSAVVESAAGEPFAAFMAREVFAPLGMDATVPDVARQPAPEQARNYWPRARRDTSYGLEHPMEVDYSCFAGAGFYLSTPSDLVRFGLAMDNHALLDPATTALLQTPLTLPSGESTGYGLGWDVQTVAFGAGETLRLGHPGIAVGGTTSLQRFPEHGIVVAVSTNVTFAELEPLAGKVAELFAQAGR